MCGIIGYIGTKPIEAKLISLLKMLEYRGYDSAGIGVVEENKIKITKTSGKIENLEKIITASNAKCGIAHTRWATHGAPTEVNSHPHISEDKSWAIVHNGIIENFSEIKKELEETYKTKFESSTDTETIAQLLQIASKNQNELIYALINTAKKLKGSFALACINKNEDNKLFLAKRKSPLYIAKNNHEVFVASDPICFYNKANEYYSLDENEFCEANINNLVFYDENKKKILKKPIPLNNVELNIGKMDYEYYMLKEINETPNVLSRIITTYKQYNLFNKIDKTFIKKFNHIVFVGCGTAYHAGLLASKYFEKYTRIRSQSFTSSEFRYENPIIDKKTLCIFISQSGETADTLAANNLARKKKATTIALTNVAYSTLAKNVDLVLPVCAGPEIAVASTKAYSAQITILYMLSRHIENLKFNKNYDYLSQIENLSKNYKIDSTKQIISLSKKISKQKQLFYLGRSLDYITAEEGSLKLKEISYINSNAYPAGELKHGFIALVEKGSYVFVIASQKNILDKTLNAAHEAKARGAKIVLFSQFDLPKEKIEGIHKFIKLQDFDEELMPIVSISTLQQISYHTCLFKGLNPDQPRNLAKSVTVE